MKLKLDNKGVSLALTIGLLLLLITITATVNELVIRALRASHQIEASDKAYFAAEGGIENALYELSAHTAGYETDSLGSQEVRNDDLTETVAWRNEWEIKNKGLNDCDSMTGWEPPFIPGYCGRIYGGEKLVLNLFSDDADSAGAAGGGVDTNGISEEPALINTLSVSDIEIKFRIPISVVSKNTVAFPILSPLSIDNDGDYNTGSGAGLNEDGVDDKAFCGGPVELDDGDCDNREDEDSPEDPVILWKLVDDSGNSFQPLRGCKDDDRHSSHSLHDNAILCENNFVRNGDEVWVSLSETDNGIFQNGNIDTLKKFLESYPLGSTNALQMEILVVAPMQAVDTTNRKKIPIPYLEYGIEYDAGIDVEIPSTYFSIKSDGHYRDFKQSITTNVVPRATTRLLDLTIMITSLPRIFRWIFSSAWAAAMASFLLMSLETSFLPRTRPFVEKTSSKVSSMQSFSSCSGQAS